MSSPATASMLLSKYYPLCGNYFPSNNSSNFQVGKTNIYLLHLEL